MCLVAFGLVLVLGLIIKFFHDIIKDSKVAKFIITYLFLVSFITAIATLAVIIVRSVI